MIARTALTSSMLLLLAGAFSAPPASAQYYNGPGYTYIPLPGVDLYFHNGPPPGYGRPHGPYPAARAPRPLPARAIVDRLEEMGFEDVGRPRFTGTLYIVQATGPGGMRQQIVVDAIRGVVLNRTAVAGRADPYGEEPAPRPRRYGGRPLDADGPYAEPDEVAPRAARPRRGASARTGPGDSGSPPGALPSPADPRLADPRPFEGRAGSRQARTETRGDVGPAEPGAPPFGIDPGGASKPKRSTKEGEGRKAAQPPAPQKKPVAEARPAQPKPVRVIPGVTPLNAGGASAQLDNLPQPPDPPAPTGQ